MRLQCEVTKYSKKSQISSLRHKGNRKEHIFQITIWLANGKKKIYLKLAWKGRGRWFLSVLTDSTGRWRGKKVHSYLPINCEADEKVMKVSPYTQFK